jgi:creatinine amidohydrolase
MTRVKNGLALVLAFGLVVALPGFSQTKVKDLKFHEMQNYSWMRLAEIIPKVTDRIILPIGAVEPHGACAIGTDNVIPQNLAGMIWERCNALIINGHGGNTDPARKAITRLHQETGAHFMLVDREMYTKLGKDNVGKTRTEAGVVLMPAWSTSMYPEKGVGYLDFDVAKAKEYAAKKANYIAETFLEAVRRWEMMESWKK